MTVDELRGVRLGLDWGRARIGVAACDPAGVLAYPVETISPAGDRPHVLARLTAILDEYGPSVAYLGLPRHLKGGEGASAAMARGQGRWLVERFPGLEVRLVDERMTTVTASRQLHEAGRTAKSQRGVIDQVAAVAILTHALDAERHTGARAGERIDGRTSE